MLRAIIVDDEELSVKRLKRILLSESREIEVCDTFLNPLEAYEYVKQNPIDIAFLDISMPEINGMKLSSSLLDLDASIDLVFITGYDQFALQAFDMNALDYLLKPVTEERISKTLKKIGKIQRSSVIAPSLSIFLFNGLKIFRRDQGKEPLKLRSPKTEELLAFLVYKGTVSREEIIDTLWSDLEPEKAWKNLNSTLYYIRKALGANKIETCLIANRNEIRIEESMMYCDLYEFEQLFKHIRRNPEKNLSLFKQVEMLYTGEFLKGKTYEWATEKKRQLENHYIELLEAIANCYLEQNQANQSLHYFGEILKLDALREDISHEMIRLFIQLGRSNEALRQYRLLEESLQQELGIRPSQQIQDLILKLKHQM